MRIVCFISNESGQHPEPGDESPRKLSKKQRQQLQREDELFEQMMLDLKNSPLPSHEDTKRPKGGVKTKKGKNKALKNKKKRKR